MKTKYFGGMSHYRWVLSSVLDPKITDALIEKYQLEQGMTAQDLIDKTDLVTVLGAPFRSVSMERYGAGFHQMLAVIAMNLNGQRQYEVWPELARRLKATNLRGTPCKVLSIPGSAVFIQVPDGIYQIRTGTNADSPSDVVGFYVFRTWVWETSESKRVEGIKIILAASGDASYELDDNLFQWSLATGKYRTLEEAIERSTSRIREFGVNVVAPDQIRDMSRFVAAALLYATCENADILVYVNPELARLREQLRKYPKGRKRDRLAEQIRTLSQDRPVVRLGVAIKPPVVDLIAADVKKDLTTARGADSVPTGRTWTLGYRTMTKGHFRWQPYGPGRQERKHIYVEPYWRGPDMARQIELVALSCPKVRS